MTLKGKVALVAGGTRGAGRGIAVELGAVGATVYVTGRTTRDQAKKIATLSGRRRAARPWNDRLNGTAIPGRSNCEVPVPRLR